MKEFKKAGDKVTIEDVYESCRRYITNEDDMKLIKKLIIISWLNTKDKNVKVENLIQFI